MIVKKTINKKVEIINMRYENYCYEKNFSISKRFTISTNEMYAILSLKGDGENGIRVVFKYPK